jgi:Na+-transporting NADH:ubiquinone oxidoreductase subunit NqrB
MSNAAAPDAGASIRQSVRSVWLVIFIAVCTATIRISNWAASEITLIYLYGRATVAHDHLRITRMKPQLVVSNGDVLRGIGFYHYLAGVAIWLPLAIGLLLLIYYKLTPTWQQSLMQVRERNQSVNAVALVWGLALFFLVTGRLPMWAAMALAAASVAVALIWAWKIEPGIDRLG